jgi:hypothetical protein
MRKRKVPQATYMVRGNNGELYPATRAPDSQNDEGQEPGRPGHLRLEPGRNR